MHLGLYTYMYSLNIFLFEYIVSIGYYIHLNMDVALFAQGKKIVSNFSVISICYSNFISTNIWDNCCGNRKFIIFPHITENT